MPGALYCGTCGERLVSEQVNDAADKLVGHTLNGTYYIQQKIGSGGMGEVYKAIHRKLESPVAIKIVKRELLAHSAIIHRFQREARAASKLRHPHIVAVTDFGQTDDGTLFMVMEYVAGRSLARAIAEDAPMPERRVVHIGEQILSALAEAHANHILHRDLKPENVMVEARRDAPDSVKVLDFGIAKVLAGDASASTLTQAGLVCGTPGYMSPEQLRGGEVDARSDLFSVGIVLYEMLTHKLPFDVQTPMEMLHKHLSQAVPPPGDRRGAPVSPPLEAVIMQALSAAPGARPVTADAMRDQLLAAGALQGPAPAAGTTAYRVPTEVLPRRATPAATPAPRATRPRSGGTAAPSRPSSATAPRDDATQTRRTPALQRTRSGPGAIARRTVSASSSERAVAFDPALLKRLEERLARLLGPVAPHLVKKASRGAATVDELVRALVAYLPDAREQEELLAWGQAQPTATVATRTRASPPPRPVTPAAAWDPAVLDRARRDLAVHLGPLAGIIVQRLCGRAHDLHDLYELLAREIPSEAERRAFWRLAPRDAGHP
jgi:eukaryotic-like serine/threonine-protein kinase